jgi:hypothetical protein
MYSPYIYNGEVFEIKYHVCHFCHQKIQTHIHCPGARWHVNHWDGKGRHCSEPDCEDNHGPGKCIHKGDKKKTIIKVPETE